MDTIDATPFRPSSEKVNSSTEELIKLYLKVMNEPLFSQSSVNLSTEFGSKLFSKYKMNHGKRGLAIIFNHSEYIQKSGNYNVCENLEKCLLRLDFDVKVYQNLTHLEIGEQLEKTAQADHTNHDCLLICALSLGKTHGIYAKDTFYEHDYIWTPFAPNKCPTLEGKPKVFLFETSLDKEDEGWTIKKYKTDDIPINFYKSMYADILVVCSYITSIQQRKNKQALSFIQVLTEELEMNEHNMDFMSILGNVTKPFIAKQQKMEESPQMPHIVSRLTKELVFEPKH